MRRVSSLLLTRSFHVGGLKVRFLAGVETAVRLGIKFWFADKELSPSDSILGLLFLFFLIASYLALELPRSTPRSRTSLSSNSRGC